VHRYLDHVLPGNLLGILINTRHSLLSPAGSLSSPGSNQGEVDKTSVEPNEWTLKSVRHRGPKLTATYHHATNSQDRLQLDWHISSEPQVEVLLIIDVVVSLYTESLESYPQVAMQTELVGSQLLYVDQEENRKAQIVSGSTPLATNQLGSAVYRIQDFPGSYIELAYPADFSHWEGQQHSISPDHNTLGSHWNLACELLEKGVIRRFQLRGLIVPKHNDLSFARKYLAGYTHELLPLT
jgi:hypothetical protein